MSVGRDEWGGQVSVYGVSGGGWVSMRVGQCICKWVGCVCECVCMRGWVSVCLSGMCDCGEVSVGGSGECVCG